MLPETEARAFLSEEQRIQRPAIAEDHHTLSPLVTVEATPSSSQPPASRWPRARFRGVGCRRMASPKFCGSRLRWRDGMIIANKRRSAFVKRPRNAGNYVGQPSPKQKAPASAYALAGALAKAGGGAGNRTRVRKSYTKGVYMLIPVFGFNGKALYCLRYRTTYDHTSH